jgi:hypothetical protein
MNDIQEKVADILSITNPHSREQVKEGLDHWPRSPELCATRAASFKNLQTKLKTNPSLTQSTEKHLETLGACVKELDPLLRESTEVEKEGYNQVCFRGTPWSGLNSIPFALLALSIYKSYIVPSFSIFLPLLSFIMPYILIKSFYNIPISFREYMAILWQLWNGGISARRPEDLLNPSAAVETPPKDPITQLKTLIQNGWTLFTIGQSLWHPIQQARHFMKLDANCLELGAQIIRVKGIASEIISGWGQWLPAWFSNWVELCPSGAREAFAFVIDTPFWLKHILRGLGRFEILFKLAMRSDVVAAEFLGGSKPVLMLKEFGDPSIPMERRVLSSFRLGAGVEHHAVLTGPNRGGKSSFLRGVLLNVVCSHAFGAAFCNRAQITPFTWIADGMRLDDAPGKQSMFEREVAFGSAVAAKEGGRGLVVYDELFHSTNPPDAQRTSELFCDRLWKKENCLSIVSTHVYSLAREAPESVKKVCVGAWKTPAGKFLFSYKLQRGICEVSSVDLLLKQFGLISRGKSP